MSMTGTGPAACTTELHASARSDRRERPSMRCMEASITCTRSYGGDIEDTNPRPCLEEDESGLNVASCHGGETFHAQTNRIFSVRSGDGGRRRSGGNGGKNCAAKGQS